MSIYATWLSLAHWNVPPEGWVDLDEPPGPLPPIVYQGSHILPSNDDDRDGYVMLCAIPGFVERRGRPPLDNSEEGEDRVHPWLRLSVGPTNGQDCVVLDREQVRAVVHTLGEWLVASA